MLAHDRQAGFTLIETLMVIALIALLAAVLAPSMIPTPNNQLRANVAELISALRAARLHAMRSREAAALQIDTEQKTFQPPGSSSKALNGDFNIQLTTVQSELTDGSRGAIRFFPDGSSTGGRITLSNGNLIQHVDVAWLTGRVRLLKDTP